MLWRSFGILQGQGYTEAKHIEGGIGLPVTR